MLSLSNLFKSRSQRHINGKTILVQKNVPSLVQVKIRTDTLGFVAKEKQTMKKNATLKNETDRGMVGIARRCRFAATPKNETDRRWVGIANRCRLAATRKNETDRR